MSAEPWSKFFWSDYDADEGLRMCSLAAQGLWMRMLCLMARATPKGELRVGGEPCTVPDLSRAVGENEEAVQSLLGELKRRGVYSATRTGVIYCRRMRNDAVISRKRAEAGAIGASVRYGKERENIGCHSKTEAKTLAKASLQKPEARRTLSGSARARAKALPDEWTPEPFGEETEAARIERSWSASERKRQVERFRDYHRAKGSKFADWQAAWGAWTRNSVEFARRRGPAEPGSFLEHLIEKNRREAAGAGR